VPNLVQNYLKDLNIVWDVQQQFEEKQDNLWTTQTCINGFAYKLCHMNAHTFCTSIHFI
jgi:hypothetical protein